MLQIYKVFINKYFILFQDCSVQQDIVVKILKNKNPKHIFNSDHDLLDLRPFSHLKDLYHYIINSSKYSTNNIIYTSQDVNVFFQKFINYFDFLVAAGGVVVNDQNEVLMIYKNNIWDLPKGKVDYGELDFKAAIREVWEETNVSAINGTRGFFNTYHVYDNVPNMKNSKKMILKETRWFLMKPVTDVSLEPQIEEGIEDVAWIPFNKLKNINTYNSIKEVLNHYLCH